MKVQITARHFKASESLQEQVQEEIDRLERFYDKINHCHVILDAEKKTRLVVEVTLGMRGKTLVSKATADVMGKALDEAIMKIERQVKKLNEKKQERRKSGVKGLTEEVEEEPEDQ